MSFDGFVNNANTYSDFVEEIKNFSKRECVADYERHIAILKTGQKVIGVSMSHIRAIARKILKKDAESFLEYTVCGDFQNEFFEETLIQGLVIADLKDLNRQMFWFEKWVSKIDNWATCDSTVTTMKKLKKAQNKNEYFDFYLKFCFSSQEFIARFGVVTLMTNYLEDEFIDQILKMVETVCHEGYYVKMAQAWLLSFAFIKFPEKTEKLLSKKTLGQFVQNKAISKCRDSFQVSQVDKERLVKYRIK